MPSEARKRRAAWPVTQHRLGEERGDLLTATTVAGRIAMVWAITLDTWATMGTPIPDYTRADSPGRIVRKHGS